MDNKMIFDLFKNIIIQQNRILLKEVAERFQLDYDELLKQYLKPEYYLPVIGKTNKD